MDTAVDLVGGVCAVGDLGLCYSAFVINALAQSVNSTPNRPHPQKPTAQPPAILINETNGERVVGSLKKIFKHHLIQPLMRSI